MSDKPGAPSSNNPPLGENCPRCARELLLLENNTPGRADFPGCPGYPQDCAWTGIVLSWTKPCHFCGAPLAAGTMTWSRKLEGKFSTTGKPLYANFHLREDECVTKVEDETPDNAKKPSPSEVGKRCYDCLREGDDTLIAAGYQLMASSIKPWHVGCALRRRREMVETITPEADERAAANNAEKSRNATRSSTPAKRPREGLARGEQLDLSQSSRLRCFT